MTTVLKLDIEKIQPGLYGTHVTSGGVSVVDSPEYPTISDAIRGVAQDTPDDFAKFYELRYSGCTTGTFTVEDLVANAEKHAADLVSLAASIANA